MKKTVNYLVGAAIAVFALSVATNANALTVGTDLYINSTSTSADTVVNVDVGGSANTSVNTEDTSISEVNTKSSDEVSVEYKRPAKLFGFINVSVKEKATVKAESDGSARVNVRKSWWSIFAKSETKTDQFESAIKTRIQNISGAGANAEANAELSASLKAQYIAEIEAASKATYTGSVTSY